MIQKATSLIAISMLGAVAFSCIQKSSNSDTKHSNIPIATPTPTPFTGLDDFGDLDKQHLDFDVEFDKFLEVVQAFQSAPIHTTSDVEKVIASMAEIFASVPKEELKSLILEKKLSFFNNMDKHISSWESQAWALMAKTSLLVEATDKDNIPTRSDVERLAKEDHGSTGSRATTGSDSGTGYVTETTATGGAGTSGTVSYNAGSTGGTGGDSLQTDPKMMAGVIALLVFGGLGITAHTYERSNIKNLVEHYKTRPLGAFFFDGAVFGKFAFVIYEGMMALNALNTGDTEKAAENLQGGLYFAAAMGAIISMYFALELAANQIGEPVMKNFTVGYKPEIWYRFHLQDAVWNKQRNWAPRTKKSLFLQRDNNGFLTGFMDENKKVLTDDDIKQIAYTRLASARRAGLLSILGAAGAGSAIYLTTNSSHLTNEPPTAIQVFMGKVARFYEICRLLSERGVLVMN